MDIVANLQHQYLFIICNVSANLPIVLLQLHDTIIFNSILLVIWNILYFALPIYDIVGEVEVVGQGVVEVLYYFLVTFFSLDQQLLSLVRWLGQFQIFYIHHLSLQLIYIQIMSFLHKISRSCIKQVKIMFWVLYISKFLSSYQLLQILSSLMAGINLVSLNLGLELSSLVVECPSSQSSMYEKKEELKFEDQEIKIPDYDSEDQSVKNDQILVRIKIQPEMNNLRNYKGLGQNQQKQKWREINFQCPRQSQQQQNKEQQKSMSQKDNQSSSENEISQSDSDMSNPIVPFSSIHEQDISSSEKSSQNEKDKNEKLYPISQESIDNSSSSYPTYPQSSLKYQSSLQKKEESNQEQSESSSSSQLVAFKAMRKFMGIYNRKTKKQIESEEEEEKGNSRRNRHKVKLQAPRKKQAQKKQEEQSQGSSSLSSSQSESESLESISSEEQEFSSSSEEICESNSVNKSYRYRNKKSIQECQFKDQKGVSKKKYQRESSSQKVSKKERVSKKRATKANQQPNFREVLKCFDKVPKLISSIEELTSVLKKVFITEKDRKEQDKN